LRELDIIVVGTPKAGEFDALRRTGRAFGVTVGVIGEMPVQPWHDIGPVFALETWRGAKAHDLRDTFFPDKVTVIMGTTNQGLSADWQNYIEGSIYIDSRGLLTAPAAGAILMYEWSRQGDERR
jgi:hypothetical protein